MGNLTRFLAVLFLLSLLLVPAVKGQEAQTAPGGVGGVEVGAIDILDPSVGDFLDIDLTALEKAANDAYQAGDYETAAKYYLASLRYDIADGGSIYNLACCYGLLGNADLAAKYLKRAVKAGFTDIEHINWDPDFDKVRGTDVLDNAVAEIAAMVEEQQAGLGDLIHTSASGFYQCRLRLPENFDPDKSYTLIVGLHGLGSNPDRFIGLWDRFESPDFIYASPQAPYPFSVGNEIGYSWETSDENDPELLGESVSMTEDYVIGVVESLKSRYRIDKVYLLGFSQGCAFTYLTGITNHELFDGLICFAGWLDTETLTGEMLDRAKGLRVFIAQGTEDRMVEYATGVQARDTLIAHGYDVTFYEFVGGHAVPAEALQAAEKWMEE